MWDVLIRSGQVLQLLPFLESLLGSFGARRSSVAKASSADTPPPAIPAFTYGSRHAGSMGLVDSRTPLRR
jgi:hypothetical protein